MLPVLEGAEHSADVLRQTLSDKSKTTEVNA